MKKTYTFISDPGHGWLKVPLADLLELGITDRISQYSYHNGKYAFLEEDCDASIFVHFVKKVWGLTVENGGLVFKDKTINRFNSARYLRFAQSPSYSYEDNCEEMFGPRPPKGVTVLTATQVADGGLFEILG